MWSSYRASAGFAQPPRFLHVTELLTLFGERPDKARREYRAFVAQGVAEIAAATSG